MRWKLQGKALYLAVAAVVGLHLYFLLSALILQTWLIDDGVQYMTLAENMVGQGTFSQSYSAPFTPDLQRTPGYPIFLVMLFRSVPLILIVQHLLVLATGWLIWRILKLYVNEEKAKIGAFLYLLQPYPIIFASMVLSETLFIFFLVAALFYYLRYFQSTHRKDLLAYALLAVAATYIRPIGLPLYLLALIPALIKGLRTPKRDYVAALTLTLALTLFLPWVLRNQQHSGRFTFNVMGDMGLLHGRLGGLEAWRKGQGADEHALYMAGDSIAAATDGLPSLREYYADRQSHETELYRKGLFGLTLSHFLSHPVDATLFQLGNIGVMLGGVGHGWAGALTLNKPASLGSAGLQLLLNLCMYLGFLLALWHVRRWDAGMWINFCCVISVLLISAAAWADGRYRVVIDPVLVVIALRATEWWPRLVNPGEKG